MPNNYSIRLLFGIFALLIGYAHAAAAAEDDDAMARSILDQADQIRFPNEGFQVDVSITTRTNGQNGDSWKYRILSKGNENTVVMVTEPASERGQIMLMKDRDLWVFIPKVSQPVRLSLSQRLTGQVANGDLARANFPEITRLSCCASRPSAARNTTCWNCSRRIAASRITR